MHLVRVLALLLAAGAEEDVALFLIDADDVIYVECSLGEIAHQAAVRIVEVEIGPAVALGPMYELLSSADEPEAASLDIGIHPLGNDSAGGVAVHSHVADVHPLEVAAHPGQVEALLVSEPFR